jgi:hypothetical protein
VGIVSVEETMRDRFEQAMTFEEFLEGAHYHRDLWRQLFDRARVPQDLLAAARSIRGRWRLLVLTEDWCGDGVNSIPVLARLAETVPQLDLRVLRRDEHPDLMDAHLTGESRSIPVVMILDHDYREVAWWGPRPGPLQDLFVRELKTLPKEERARRFRAWYARDKGRTVLREIMARIPVPV